MNNSERTLKKSDRLVTKSVSVPVKTGRTNLIERSDKPLDTKSDLETIELSAWTELMNRGTVNAVSGLAEMLGREIRITCFDLKEVPVPHAYDLFDGAETVVVAIYLTIAEGATGHILLVYPPATAYELVDMLMDNPPETTQELGEIEESALAEVGNVVGSFFLNSLADDTGIRLQPSPPHVMTDMAGAIMGIALSDIMQYGDDVFVMETVFGSEDREVNGALLVLPSADFLDVVKKHTSHHRKVSWG